ncbi:MAG: hypothetical protein R3A10_16340 [Caldilineaceae bacterium]
MQLRLARSWSPPAGDRFILRQPAQHDPGRGTVLSSIRGGAGNAS